MGVEQISYELDPRSVIGAISQMNSAVEGFEGKNDSATGKIDAAWSRVSNLLGRLVDRQEQANERLVKSYERQASAIAQTPIEREISRRDALIKKLGDNEAAIERVRKASEKLIAHMEEGEGEGLKRFGEGVAKFMESPLQGAEGAITGVIEKIGPLGAALGAGVTALAAAGAAGFEAAKGLGEYGLRVQDAAIRTGLSAQEVQKFGFAARAVGQDISVVERLMRGLTQAVEEEGTKGEEGRAWLKRFGIDLQSVRDGSISTAAALTEIGEGLEKLPNWEKQAAALDIFKKQGIEALPFLQELPKHLADAEKINFASDADLARFLKYNDEVKQIEESWSQLALKLKEPLAATVMVGLKWASDFGKENADLTHAERTAPKNPLDWEVVYPQMQAAIASKLMPSAEPANAAAVAAGVAPGAARTSALTRIGADRGVFESSIEGLKALESQAEKTAASERDTYFALRDSATASVAQIDLARDSWQKAEHAAAGYKSQIDKITGSNQALESLTRIQTKLTPKEGLLPESAEALENLTKLRAEALPEGLAKAWDIFNQEFAQVRAKLQEEFDKSNKTAPNAIGDLLGLGLKYQQESVLGRIQRAAGIRQSYISAERAGMSFEEAQALGGAELAGIAAGPGGKPDNERAIADIKKRDADEVFAYDLSLAREKHLNDGQLENAEKELRIKNAEEVYKIELDYAKKVGEERNRQVQSISKETEPLYHTLLTKPSQFPRQLRSTLHEAIVRPVSEGLSNLTAQALHPLIYGSDGKSGIAGIFRSTFGGGTLQDVRLEDGAVPVVIRKGAEAAKASNPATVAAQEAQGRAVSLMERVVPKVEAPAPFARGGGGSIFGLSPATMASALMPLMMPQLMFASPQASRAAAAVSAGMVSTSIDYGEGPVDLGSTVYGGTPGFAPGPVGVTGTPEAVRPSAGMEALGGLLGGAGSASSPGQRRTGAANPAGILTGLKNLKGSFWNEDIYSAPGVANAASSMGALGKIAGVATSPGGAALEMGVGMPLFNAGVFGNRRGTAGGMAEATAGGALTGAAIGTMILPGIGTAIGAAAGAVAGFAISGLQDLLGDQSPQVKAKNYVQSIYHISISNQEADQIAQLAQSKYGGNVQVAVRSPEVRQMLGVYAAGTGQSSKFPLSAATPHAGSLVEQSGQLFQQATYQYGNAYAYQSNLPIAGGPTAGTWPSGPMMLSLNVGADSTAAFLNGQVFTPEATMTNYSAAMSGSYGRVGNSAMIQQPGLIVS